MSSDTGDMINRRTLLLNAISEALADAVGETDRPYRWEDIPDVLAEVIRQRDEAIKAREGCAAMNAQLRQEIHYSHVTAANVSKSNTRLREERDEARAASTLEHVDDLHDAGYAAALDDVERQMEDNIGIPSEDRWQYLSGWINGRRAGL